MEQKMTEIKKALKKIGEIGLEINQFYESKIPVMTYQDALDGNTLARKLGDAIREYEDLLRTNKSKL